MLHNQFPGKGKSQIPMISKFQENPGDFDNLMGLDKIHLASAATRTNGFMPGYHEMLHTMSRNIALTPLMMHGVCGWSRLPA